MEKFQKDELVTLRNVLVAMGVQEDRVDGMIKEKLGKTNDWDKIELDGNGRVTILGLTSAGLSGTIPSELSHLSNLKGLYLDDNQLSGPIPSELSRLSNLKDFWLFNNTNLEGVVPVMPSGCDVNVSGTRVSSVAVKTKPLKTIMDYIMTVLYVVLGYADLVTDIIVIVQLISIGEDGLAAANIFFIVLGMFLGYWNSKRTLLDLFLNVSQLSILVNGYLTLAQGKQTEGLVLSKKMDAIVRSMPSIILQLYTVLKDLGEYPKGSYAFNTFVVSIALGVLGASVTLSGLHQKAGNRLFSWQFAVVNLYYFSEILLRSMLAAIAFLSVGAYAFIAVGIDVLLRGCKTYEASNNEINFSLTCLYLGSDNALNNEDAWVFGSFLTVLYSLIFIIVMWTLPTDDLHELRDRGTATQLSSIMLCAFVAKTCLYYFIEKNMEAPSEDGDTKATTKETVNELHNNV